MKVTNLKRLAKEDFSQENQALVEKLAFAINPFLDQLNQALDKNIDFDNLNQSITTFKVRVNASGIPITPVQLKSSLKTNVQGIQVIRVDNITDSTNLSGAPFITFTRNSGLIYIQHITGLVANKDYNIAVILIG